MHFAYGRRTRAGLLVLFLLFVLAAAGILLLKFQLEGLRSRVQETAELRLGGRLEVGAVQVNGLRGLRIAEFRGLLGSEDQATVEVLAPEVLVNIDVVDLLYGEVTIDQIRMDGARVLARRAAQGQWFAGSANGHESALPEALSDGPAFRIVGQDCTLRVENVIGESGLSIENLAIDVSRLSGSPDLRAKVTGVLKGEPGKRLRLDSRFASMEDFDLRAFCEELAASDINVFLPASRQFFESGTVSPNLRVAGYPNDTMIVSVEMPFQEVAVRGQPDLLEPATGTLTALANYNTASHRLSFTTAKAVTQQLAGSLEGTVSFAGAAPEFDLTLETKELPVRDALNFAVAGRMEEYGDLDIDLHDPYSIQLLLRGNAEQPQISAQADVSSAGLRFVPKDPRWPRADLEFGMMKVDWNAETEWPTGTLNLTSGTVTHAATGLEARNIAGNLVFKEGTVALQPVSAMVTQNAFVGEALYTIADQRLEFSASGELAHLERFPLGEAGKKLALSGAADFRCSGAMTPGNYQFDVVADATQAEIAYEWWFNKPVGVGASINSANIAMRPGDSITLSGNASVGTSLITAKLDVSHDEKWRLQHGRVKADGFDVATADQCLRIPYMASGGRCTGGYYEFQRAEGHPKANTIQVGGTFDELSLLADNTQTPVRAQGIKVDVFLDNRVPDARKGKADIIAESAFVPPLEVKWLLPIKPQTPEMLEKFPPKPVDWQYTVRAAQMEMPPWKGTAFEADAVSSDTETRLDRFSAKVGEGRLEGQFALKKEDNFGKLKAKWERIPAVYVIRHLDFPDLLTGTMSGEVDYTVDHDDPSTLEGQGSFDIADGRFSADFLFNRFEEQLSGEMGGLPASLKFSRLRSDVRMKGDLVKTPNLLLEAQGITVRGNGQFYVDGDLDYQVKVALTPETAERIPVLRDAFNIEGHRITQNRIELAFRVHGPTFNPNPQVEELPPLGVTLVSGAAEVTSEAIKVIDVPRQILLDLFKIGGGIVGVGK